MRTFHIGGAAQVTNESSIEANTEGKAKFHDAAVVARKDKSWVVIGRRMQVEIIDSDGRTRQSFRPAYGTRLMIKDGAKVKPGELLAEWDPFAQPIVSEIKGEIKLVDVVDGVTVREETDEATGIASRVIIDWRTATKAADLKPSVHILDAKGEPVKLPNGNDAVYLLSVGAIMSVSDGDKIEAGDSLARITTGGAKTKDITGGLPRVAELFEARRPKDHAIIAEIDGKVLYGRDYKNKRRISIVPLEEGGGPD